MYIDPDQLRAAFDWFANRPLDGLDFLVAALIVALIIYAKREAE